MCSGNAPAQRPDVPACLQVNAADAHDECLMETLVAVFLPCSEAALKCSKREVKFDYLQLHVLQFLHTFFPQTLHRLSSRNQEEQLKSLYVCRISSGSLLPPNVKALK